MVTIEGVKPSSIQIQLKNSDKSLSFTIKNVELTAAYSAALCLFQRMALNDNNTIELTLYNTKNKQEQGVSQDEQEHSSVD